MTDEIPTDPPVPQAGVPQAGVPQAGAAQAGLAPSGATARARIEPTVPPKKRDALPVLYLVGFVILAAALVYLYRHPAVPRMAPQDVARVDTLRQDSDALNGRIVALEARPVPPPPVPAPNLAPLEARLAELERRPAPVPAPPTDLGPLTARIDALDKKQADDAAAMAGKLDQASRQASQRAGTLTGRLDQIEARIAAAEAQGKQNAAALGAITERAGRFGRLQAATAALDAGQRLGEIPGAPPALARFANDAPPTEAGLRLSFGQAAEAAQRASQPAITDNQPFLDRMWTRAQQSVTVRQGDKVLVGDPIAGVIQHARQQLEAGDLAGAIRVLDGLAGPAKAAMADWVGRAQSLLDARAAIAEMAVRG